MVAVKNLGLHFYGADGPIIVLEIDGHRGLYDREGLEHLIYHYRTRNVDSTALEDVLFELDSSKYLPLPDLSLDDISGQAHLF